MGPALRLLQRFLAFLRYSWSLIVITLILIFLTEAGFQLVFTLKDRRNAETRPDHRVLGEGYGGATWPIQHYRELERIQERWEPYSYFRPKPFSGQTITIGEDGLRKTWSSPSSHKSSPNRTPIRILMLGGSSLWGFGARDDQTIPSLLASQLSERRWNVQIRNLAQIGHVSTQEVVSLIRELQSGYRPDLVIFYDGVNDTTSALLEGEVGLTTNESNRRREFNLLQSPKRLGGALFGYLIKESASYRFALSIRQRVSGSVTKPGREFDDAGRDRLAREIVRRFWANVEIVKNLGREFQFSPIFFWQPVIFTKPLQVPFEREESARFAWAEPIFRNVIWHLRELPSDLAFQDLSGIFADSNELVFIDYCHTTESANARIASEIAERVKNALPSIRPEKAIPPGNSEPIRGSIN